MTRIFTAVVVATFIAGLVPATAAGMRGGGGAHSGGISGTRGMRLNTEPEPALRVPNMQSRIPAPLPAPAGPPAINGPLSPSSMPSMGNGLR